MLTVHELRKRGYRVQVRHNRCFGYTEVEGEPMVLSKGGATEILITRPVPPHMEGRAEGLSVVGVAECSPKENFSRKRGVRIALGRALKQLGLPTK